MTTTYTLTGRLWMGTPGDPAIANVWGTALDTNFTLIDSMINGTTTISLTGQSSPLALTANNGAPDQSRELVLQFTGTLAANFTITLPNVSRFGWAINNTSGGFGVILSVGAGATATIPADGLWHAYYTSAAGVTLPVFSTGTTALSGSSLVVSGPASITGGLTVSGGLNSGGSVVVTNNGATYNINIAGTAANLTGAPVVRANGQVYNIGISGNAATASSVPYSGLTAIPFPLDQSVAKAATPTFQGVQTNGGAIFGVAANIVNQVTVNPLGNGVLVTSALTTAYSAFNTNLTSVGQNIGLWLFGGSTVGSITQNGASTAYNTTSDRRLKIDRGPFSHPGRIIDGIAVKWFNWKSDPDGEQQPGFFAQQVHRWFPWAVTKGRGRKGRKNYLPWQLDMAKMMPLVLAELQALRARVKELERQIG